MDKITLGINIDGLSVQAALVRYSQGLIVIEQLDSFKLFDSLEQSSAEIDKSKKTNDIQIDDSDNPFGMDINVSHQPTSDVAQARGNVDVIIELLSKMSPFGCPIAFNLQNSNVFYKSFQIDNTTKPSKIRKFIWEEFNESNEGFANLQNIDFIRHNNGTCLGVIHNDPLIFSNLLQQAIKLTKRPQSPIHLIDTIEFALAEYLCRTIGISAQDRLSVIYFSQNFTKIFFMNGSKIEDVLPTIHTGSKSATICETAFSKILYEFDFKGIDAPKKLVLAGEIAQVNADFFFKEKFPELDIISLEPSESLLAPDLKTMAGNVAPYATAIALALKNLLPKKEKTYKSNFLPKRIKEKQSQFVVAWHGFAALGAIMLTILFLFAQTTAINNDTQKTRSSLNKINEELLLLGDVEHQVDSLRLEIRNIETGASLIDSLASATTRWTPLVESFSNAFNEFGFFNVNQFASASSKKMLVELNLSNLTQVVLLERYIKDSKVLTVKDTESEETEELLQLTIECDLSNQYLNEKQFKLTEINDSTTVK